METGIGPLGYRERSVLDLAKHVTFRAPTELVYRVSRSALLVFVGFTIGQAAHGKSDIEKVYDRVTARGAEILQATQKKHEQSRGVIHQHTVDDTGSYDDSKP